jgi:glutamyl-tRNA synthetase
MLERPLEAEDEALLERAMPALKPRAKTLIELAEGAVFLFDQVPLTYEDKARGQIDEAPEGVLDALANGFAALDDWSIVALEDVVRDEADRRQIGLGKLAGPLRAALTGRTISPGIFDVLWLLGRDESLQRINAALPA